MIRYGVLTNITDVYVDPKVNYVLFFKVALSFLIN